MSGPTLARKGMLMTNNPQRTLALNDTIPIDYIIDWFKQRATLTGIENRVLILKSETASGKSTYLPPEMYKRLIMSQPSSIPGLICTQPRVLTAITNLRDQIMKWYGTNSTNSYSAKILTLGKNTGWITGNSKVMPSVNAALLSTTLDTLTVMLRTQSDEEIIKKFRYILLDEIHERSISLDTTVAMLKSLVRRCANNVDCPFVVLMSATFDPMVLLGYFGVQQDTNFIHVIGENAPIVEMWDRIPHPCDNYITEAANIVKDITNAEDKDRKKDILIFMPSVLEAEQVKQKLVDINMKLANAGKEVFSLMTVNRPTVLSENIDFKRLTEPLTYMITIDGKQYLPTRRIIIANSVAETGLTLDDLKHVIDSGYHFGKEYIPTIGANGMWASACTKSRWQQRRGRVGRSQPGVYWPLYPKYIWEKLDQLQKPDIQIADISPIFIYLIAEQYRYKYLNGDSDPEFSLADIDLIDIPSPDMLLNCLEKFYTLGFLSVRAPKWAERVQDMVDDDKDRFGITRLGHIYTRIIADSITPECVRMVFASYSWGISTLDVITIAAYLCLYDSGVKIQRGTPRPDMGKVYKASLPGYLQMSGDMLLRTRILIADYFLDGLFQYQAVAYLASKGNINDAATELRKWCDEVGLVYDALLEFIAIRDKFIEQFISAGFNVFLTGTSIFTCSQVDFMDVLCRYKHVIYDGYRCNLLTRRDNIYYTTKMMPVIVTPLFDGFEQKVNELGHIETLKFEPTYIVCNSLQIKKNKKNIYSIRAVMYSVMDGFVSTDASFVS